MPWVLLVVAGLFEVVWATGLKYADGFTRLRPSVGTAMAMGLSVLLLGLAFSPSLPVTGDARQAFDRITRPMLSITGTRDQDMLGTGASPERRMAVFAALPSGSKAHRVLQDADHMTFAGQTGRAAEIVGRESVTRNLPATHHASVAAITTDWWRSTLMDDAAARKRLEQPASLSPGDLWQQR